ncbi:MAG: hypothetical protein LBT56_02410 [Prevotellaceae bacterium]|jgi:hypothetical protein|nr:hypothetical protein [Prevotellaceae bacterium]
MKLLKNITFIALLSLMIAACGGGLTPSKVSENFFDALIKNNIEEAKKYVIKELIPMCDEAIEQMKMQQENLHYGRCS